jgi:hypothetical protein
MNGHHLSSTTAFTRQHARKPSTPPNRPNPLCFTPPNGRDWKIRMKLFSGNLKKEPHNSYNKQKESLLQNNLRLYTMD